jgi:ATP-binding cassette subfamily B protein
MCLPWAKGRFALLAESARGRYAAFAVYVFATGAGVLLAFLTPQIIRVTIDSLLGDVSPAPGSWESAALSLLAGISPQGTALWLAAAAVAAAAALSAVFNILRRYIGLEIAEYMAQRLRDTLFAHIQRLPYEWHVMCRTGDIIQRCTSDVDTVRNFFSNHFTELLRTVSVFAAAIVIMFSMDTVMTLVSLALLPVIFVFSALYFRSVAIEFGKADAAEGAMQACAQENYTGVRVVRAFGRERFEAERFEEKTTVYTDLWIKIGKMLGTFWGMGDILSGTQIALVVGAGILRCAHGGLTPGAFLAFYVYCNMMIWPVRALGRIIAELSKTAVSAGRIREILAAEPEEDAPDSERPDIKGEVTFDNVTFGYHGSEPVLRGVSFSLSPGQTLAVLGGTGSGKSTLAHLLCRLYDVPPGQGRILIDGVDIRRIARSHLRSKVGMLLQEPFLFSKTLRENIAITRPNATEDEIIAAARIAYVHDSVMSFGEGYATLVGERGVTLSGGQKQRVAITRMLLSKAPIMVFDDSLSAVDTETDAKIRAALRKETKDAVVIIISHRISTLMQADRIMVLHNGTVEEMGSHEELLAAGGSYRRIYDLQSSMDDRDEKAE